MNCYTLKNNNVYIEGLRMNSNIEDLKELVILKESIDNVLIKVGFNYHVVSMSVIDFDEDYIFNIEGYSCSFEIKDIDEWVLISEIK